MKIFIYLVSVATIFLALVLAAAGPGTRLGLWEYGFGLQLLFNLGMPLAIATALSLAALIASFFTARNIILLPLLAVILSGGATTALMKMRDAGQSNPVIHDITTDFVDPPQIIAAADEERNNPPHYVGDEPAPRTEMTTAEAQRDAFPDIKPVRVEMSVEDAASAARDTVKKMGLKLLNDAPTDDGWLIEAAYTSVWFGFVDDFIVRVRPDGDGAIIDLRSKSRVGMSDLGANAARIRTFISEFEKATA